MWSISAADKAKYEALFDQLEPVNNKLEGNKCRLVMMKSELSTETLGRIWDLSDIDDDGCLDKSEFVLAMYLCHRCSEGAMLPDSLPASLIPPQKESFLFRNASFSPADSWLHHTNSSSLPVVPFSKPMWSDMSLVPVVSSPIATVPMNQVPAFPNAHNYPPWSISPEELTKSNQIFKTIDADADGLATGPEVREVLIRFSLPQPILAQIWNLVDLQGTGMLNCEQFAVALHLVTDQLASSPYTRTLPTVLPAALVPPSFRPVPPDPAMFEQSSRLTAEIEAINRERFEVENSYNTLTMETQRLATESASIQSRLDTLSHTSLNLMTQRSEAEHRLSNYEHEKNMLQTMLSEIKDNINDERKLVEQRRDPLRNQQEAVKKEAAERLRTELSDLIREASQLQEQLTEKRRRLEQIEAENQNAQQQIEQILNRIQSLESTRDQLQQLLDQPGVLPNGKLELDETKVAALLNGFNDHGSVRSLETAVTNKSSGIAGDNQIDWTSNGRDQDRVLGSASVPLPVMQSSRMDATNQGAFAWDQPVFNSPIMSDPFHGVDPFSSESNTKPEQLHNTDPFASQFSTSDPFAGLDPFGCEPFTPWPNCSVTFPTNKNSAFDPFTSLPTQPSTNTAVSAEDFDAAFRTPRSVSNFSDDPFGGDPFTSLEQKVMTNDKPGDAMRSPPPRPTSKPGAGRLANKSTGNLSNRSTKVEPVRTVGSLRTEPLTSSTRPLSGHKSRLSSGSDKFNMLSRVPDSKAKSPSSGHANSLIPTGLTEDEQLKLAIRESQQITNRKEQEDADLQLALQLSLLETRRS